MFTIRQTHDFDYPVTVRVPGTKRPETFKGLFRSIPAEEAEAWRLKGGDENSTADELIDGQVDQISEILLGWDGVQDEDKNKVAFSEESLEAACRFGWFRIGVIEAYAKAISGREEKRKGN